MNILQRDTAVGPGREVRLRNAYIIKCVGVVKDETSGEVVEVRCTHEPETRSGPPPDGRKVDGIIHWVSVPHSVAGRVRLYDRLFLVSNPLGEKEDFINYLNPKSIETLTSCVWNRAWRVPNLGADSSSSGSAISVSIPWIPLPATLYSTAPQRCGTPGPRLRQSEVIVLLVKSEKGKGLAWSEPDLFLFSQWPGGVISPRSVLQRLPAYAGKTPAKIADTQRRSTQKRGDMVNQSVTKESIIEKTYSSTISLRHPCLDLFSSIQLIDCGVRLYSPYCFFVLQGYK